MIKPFIHPNLLLTVRENVYPSHEERLDIVKFEEAKSKGINYANNLLNKLFNKIEYGNIESHFNTELLNSTNFDSIREQIINLHFQREVITKEVNKYSEKHNRLTVQLSQLQNSFFKFLFKKRIQRLTEEVAQSKVNLDKIKEVEEESYLKVTYTFDTPDLKAKYSDLVSAFTTLKSAHKIWDMTYSERNTETKAAAQTSMSRNEVKFTFAALQVIQTTEKTFHFENSNGGDFYFYPSFIVYYKNVDDIAILDYGDLQINYSESRFLEESHEIAIDTKIIGETWYRVNKDGSPDKRFVNNYQIPIVLYGSVHLKSESGINELYYISDWEKAKHFCEQYRLYQSLQGYSW